MYFQTNTFLVLLEPEAEASGQHACSSQHDEVEPNLKKILHTNGILGLEANSM